MFTAKQLKTNNGFIFIYKENITYSVWENEKFIWIFCQHLLKLSEKPSSAYNITYSVIKRCDFWANLKNFTIYVFNPLQSYHGRSDSNKKMLGSDMKPTLVNMTLAKSFICFLVTVLLSTVAATRDRTCCSYACKSSIDSEGRYTNTCPDWCQNQDSCVLR